MSKEVKKEKSVNLTEEQVNVYICYATAMVAKENELVKDIIQKVGARITFLVIGMLFHGDCEEFKKHNELRKQAQADVDKLRDFLKVVMSLKKEGK